MNNIKPLVCKCCGASVDRITLICKFCGVEYELSPKPMKIEIFQNPVEHFSACFNISDEMLYKMSPTDVSKIAVDNLVRELSKSIPICMDITVDDDMHQFGRRYRGDIRMIRPKNRGDVYHV